MQLNNRSQGGNSHHIQTSDCITVDPALDSHADMKRDSQMMNVCAGCNQVWILLCRKRRATPVENREIWFTFSRGHQCTIMHYA